MQLTPPGSTTDEVPSSLQCAREVIASTIDGAGKELATLNNAIHSHPELGYQEVFAHASIADFLESQKFAVQRHAYGLETAFVAEAGSGGRLVILCAEYDALPGIGHGCGHNLIATVAVAAFLGVARALAASSAPGRVWILGTPAEEGGGGKIKLLEAGAFSTDPVAAALMCHALPQEQIAAGHAGIAGFRSIASQRFLVEFRGKNAHAGQEPWNGVNALDAAVGAYVAVSMLRQQIRPDDRIQGIIEKGGEVPNIIPDYTRMNWAIRSPSIERVNDLYGRVKDCIDGAARAAGCSVTYTPTSPYMELRVNDTLCNEYIKEMGTLGDKIVYKEDKPSSAGTDMGNVSYAVPSFHGMFGIPTAPGVPVHHKDFAEASGTEIAHSIALKTGKALAMLAYKVLVDDDIAFHAATDFAKGLQGAVQDISQK
ncbi:hypothetical protein BX600DRAFT_521293 [Xylariales sp. PMI_506]|nr:hypothetical protein BX600DRAFT_521293 [Xylariales sp. PMI_506]